MFRFPAVRNRLLALHLLLILILGGSAGFAAWRLLAFPPDPAAAAGLIVLVADGVLLPAVLQRLVWLFTAEYRITPTGSLILRIGPRREVLPVADVEEIRSGGKIPPSLRKAAPGWLDGWQGEVPADGEDAVEWIATDRGPGLLLLVAKQRLVAVSPSDPAGFAHCVNEISTQGSLERTEPLSIRPSQTLRGILRSPPAAVLLASGLATAAGLGAFLTGIQPSLPSDQPFRFDPTGLPSGLGDPLRLLLLPAAGGAVWLINAVIGWWMWKENQRQASYALWLTALIVEVGLWVACALLLRAG
jgi:hypothetical protein